jgi:hypothetical protein
MPSQEVRVSPSGPFVTVGGGGGGGGRLLDLSVNAAGVDRFEDLAVVLRTGSRVNVAGAYTGGGTGNKAIMGVLGFDGLALGALLSVAFTWENVVGPGGTTFSPPGAASVTVPYVNLVVDFGGGDLRVLVLMDAQLNPAVSAAIGVYTNPGGLNVITHSWTAALGVLIVNAPPDPVPGGVAPIVSVGPAWPEKVYSMAALVAANPLARLVDAFPGAPSPFPAGGGGLPAGAIIPGVVLASGDSGTIVRSGKRVRELLVNGDNVLLA